MISLLRVRISERYPRKRFEVSFDTEGVLRNTAETPRKIVVATIWEYGRQLRVRVTRFHKADRYGVMTPSPRISARMESWQEGKGAARYDEEAAAADITEQITRLVPCRWGSFNCPNWYRVALRVGPPLTRNLAYTGGDDPFKVCNFSPCSETSHEIRNFHYAFPFSGEKEAERVRKEISDTRINHIIMHKLYFEL